MSAFLGKIMDNLKNNQYINNGINKFKSNKLVTSSVEVCSIAKEVYASVKNEDSSPRKIEDHYLDATTKVSSVSKEEVENRIDYKMLHKTASTGRKIKKLTKKSTMKLIDEYNELKEKILQFFVNFRSNCTKLFGYIKDNLDTLLEKSPEQMKAMLEQMKKFVVSFYNNNKLFFTKLTDKLKLKEILDYTWRQTVSLKNRISETCSVLRENLSKNTQSVKKLIGFNIEYVKLIFNKNWHLMTKLIKTNEEVLNSYFKTLDVEIYYGEGNIAKPISYLRNLYGELIQEGEDTGELVEVS